MIKMRGRQARVTMLDGEMVEVRSMFKLHKSMAIILPKMWLEVARMNGEFTEIAIQQKDNVIIIKPFYTKPMEDSGVK
jgi:hypothetical protein